jgi:RsiW-degrading membrane proteinase PrsW (M82 family)
VLPVPVTLVGLLVCIAVIEEVAKSAHVFAGFEHARYDRSVRTALLVGVLSGLGFFVAEKFIAVVQVVGLTGLEGNQGSPIFPAGTPGLDPILVVALLFAPLALHTVTAALSSLGARKSANWWIAGMTGAIVVHVLYNYAVIEVIGSGV